MSEASLTNHLIDLITPLVTPLGYEIVYLEVDQRGKILRLFIDHLDKTRGVGIQDCVKVTKALDEPLDLLTDLDQAFGNGGYELEVSSPGIDRPLRTERDFDKFKGREIRIHVFRPLTGEELGNSGYQSKNSKQKNFLGTLQGFAEGKVHLALNLTGGHDKTQKKPLKKSSAEKNSVEGKASDPENVVTIPLPLISKANLEPDFTDLE